MKLIAKRTAPHGHPDPCQRVEGCVRLFQYDIATTEPRTENGWVIGTFIYDGRALEVSAVRCTHYRFILSELSIPNFYDDPDVYSQRSAAGDPGWDRLLPVGLIWGCDPQLNQKEFDQIGKRPLE